MVPRAVIEAMTTHARAESPHECCGLLIGRDDRIVESVPKPNTAADPARQYEVAPREYIAEMQRCRKRDDGLAVIGCYHSHPRSEPAPSATDRAAAFRGFLFLILGPVNQAGPIDVRAYQLGDDTFEPVRLVINAEG